MNSTATVGLDNITQLATADTLTVDALGTVAAGDFFDGAAGTDIINVSYTGAVTDQVDFRLATLQNYDGLTFLNNAGLNNVSFNAAQFGVGAGTNNAAFAITGASGTQSVHIYNAHNFNASGFTFSTWLSGSDWMNFYGSAGNDTFLGSVTGDRMTGGLGNDTYNVDGTKDEIIELADEGIDTVISTALSHTLGDNVENLILGVSGNNGTGNALNNTITGNGDSNVIDGGAGIDTMTGGDGNDTYVVDVVDDVIIEGNGVGSGTDTVETTFTYSIVGTNLDNIELKGTGVINATGNDADNRLTGNGAINILTGGIGNDTLDGKGGNDTMLGGAGNDSYVVDSATDVVTETLSSGTDSVSSSVTFTLAAHIENLTLSGSTAINGTGNNSANAIDGNSAANTLSGGGGNDVIDGNRGADAMIGGTGNDTYFVDNLGDTATEGAAAGTDDVRSSVSFTLGANVENLLLTGSSALVGIGNDLDNVITGSSAANTLTGGLGNDTINGGSGSDTMDGGGGNDTYTMDVATDSVTEAAASGTDTVNVGFNNYVLGANIENLNLTTGSSVTATGNSENNIINGSFASNTLSGMAGDDYIDGGSGGDTMSGGAGNDTYVVDSTLDVVTELFGEGTDHVFTKGAFTLGDNFENLTLTGTVGVSGTGNAQNNILTGNGAANILRGLAGSDDFFGGNGNDRIYGGTGADDMTGGAGNDQFVFEALSDSNTASGIDFVFDFTTGDKINLYTVDANTTIAGNQTFVLDTNGLLTAGEVKQTVLSGGFIQLDISTDNDATIDMTIVVHASSLIASDFIL